MSMVNNNKLSDDKYLFVRNIEQFTGIDFTNVRVTDATDNGKSLRLFCLDDVLVLLDFDDVERAIKQCCNTKYYCFTPVIIKGQNGKCKTSNHAERMQYITELELYKLVFSSKTSNVEKIINWFYGTLVPTVVDHVIVPNCDAHGSTCNIADIIDLKKMIVGGSMISYDVNNLKMLSIKLNAKQIPAMTVMKTVLLFYALVITFSMTK